MLTELLKTAKPAHLFSLADKLRNEFEKEGLPIVRQGRFKYLPLKKFYDKSIDLCQEPSYVKTENGLCFYNGFLQENKEVFSQIEVMNFDQAMDAYSLELAHEFQKEVTCPFTKMALCYPRSGLFIYVPKDTKLKSAIHLDFLVDQKRGYANPLVKIFVASGAEVTFESRFFNKGSNGVHNSVITIDLAKNAVLNWVNIKKFDREITSFDSFRVKQADASQFNYSSMTNGSENFFQNIEVDLDGYNADCNIKGFYTLKERAQSHVHVQVRHNQESCTSNQYFRGLLTDESVASFRGNIYVDRLAQKTDAYQMCNHLMLGPKAKAIAEPNLEIFADDVKASHGATMKRLDQEDLFYFKSRGINEALASKILARGFCMSAVEHLSEALKKEALEFFNA